MIAIREARPGETATITALINRAYEVEAFFKVGTRTNEREIAGLLVRDSFLVAEDESHRVLGAVRVSANGSEGHLGMLAIEPSLQGNGLGRRMVAAAEAWALERGCTSMWLETVNLREELPPFYRKLGYEITGTQPWPEDSLERISRPAHFILMSKALPAVARAAEAGR